MDAQQQFQKVLTRIRGTRLNQTSGSFLEASGLEYLSSLAERQDPRLLEGAATVLRDLRIKQRSYAVINKVAWWAGLLMFFAALAWRPLGVRAEGPYEVLLTAVAGAFLALHTTYKKRQTALEGVMRALFLPQELADWMNSAIETAGKIDAGTRLEDLKPKDREPDQDQGNKNNDTEDNEQ